MASIQPARALGEQVEDVGQQTRVHAHSLVAHPDHRAVAVALRAQLDRGAVLAVFRCVVQQVRDDLRQACRVALQPHRLAERHHVQPLRARIDGRLHGLDAFGDHGVEIHLLAAQCDLAVADACHVEQLVDQARHLAELPDHDVRSPGGLRVRRRGPAYHFHRRAYRRQRVAQLVREHRQELVLASGLFLQLGFDSAPLDDLGLQRAVQARVLQCGCCARGEVVEDGPVRLLLGPGGGHQQCAMQPVAVEQRHGDCGDERLDVLCRRSQAERW